MGSSRDPELAGASKAVVRLTGNLTRATVPLNGDVSLVDGTEGPGEDRRVYLELQGIRGNGPPGNYRVLIDMPDDNQVPLVAGVFSTFGVERASQQDAPHGGSGLNQIFDITRFARELGLVEGNTEALDVMIQRVGATDDAWGVPEGLEGVVAQMGEDGNIEIGRINVIFR